MGWFKVEFEGFSEIIESFFFRGPLAGNIDFQALRHVPVTLTPDTRGKRSLHGFIVSHGGWDSVVPRTIVRRLFTRSMGSGETSDGPRNFNPNPPVRQPRASARRRGELLKIRISPGIGPVDGRVWSKGGKPPH